MLASGFLAEPAQNSGKVELRANPKNDAHPTEEVTIVLGIDCHRIGRNGPVRRAGDDRSTIAGSDLDENGPDTHPQNLQKVDEGASVGAAGS
jgi:hypothetical protein